MGKKTTMTVGSSINAVKPTILSHDEKTWHTQRIYTAAEEKT
jgi:hypothetical protein